MRNGICPKCEQRRVYVKYQNGGSESGNTIPIGGFLVFPAKLDNYVCTNCGYVESYISDEYNLAEIAKRWKKVDPSATPTEPASEWPSQ